MPNRNSESRKRQRGQALILVLIVLVLGSLLITPMLRYVSTGLIEARIFEKMLLTQYAADAAVEYTLWQLQYNVDGLIEQLNPENPSSNTLITVNGIEVSVTTEISQSPQSDNGSVIIPQSQSGIHVAATLEILPPRWSESGQKGYLTHLVYIYNYGTSAVHLKSVFQRLDPSLMYVENSYEGPDAKLTKRWVDDHWELYFDFNEPLPKLNAQEIMVISFIAWTVREMGEYTFSGSGSVSYAGFKEDEIVTYSGESGLVSFGLYDITVTIGDYTILANVGVTEEGEIVVRSYQVNHNG